MYKTRGLIILETLLKWIPFIYIHIHQAYFVVCFANAPHMPFTIFRIESYFVEIIQFGWVIEILWILTSSLLHITDTSLSFYLTNILILNLVPRISVQVVTIYVLFESIDICMTSLNFDITNPCRCKNDCLVIVWLYTKIWIWWEPWMIYTYTIVRHARPKLCRNDCLYISYIDRFIGYIYVFTNIFQVCFPVAITILLQFLWCNPEGYD